MRLGPWIEKALVVSIVVAILASPMVANASPNAGAIRLDEPTVLTRIWKAMTEFWIGLGLIVGSDSRGDSLQSAPSQSATPPDYDPGPGSASTAPPVYPNPKPDDPPDE